MDGGGGFFILAVNDIYHGVMYVLSSFPGLLSES